MPPPALPPPCEDTAATRSSILPPRRTLSYPLAPTPASSPILKLCRTSLQPSASGSVVVRSVSETSPSRPISRTVEQRVPYSGWR